MAASLCAHPPAAFAQGSSPGKWRETGYIEDETGKRTPCTGEFCSSPRIGVVVQDVDAFCRKLAVKLLARRVGLGGALLQILSSGI